MHSSLKQFACSVCTGRRVSTRAKHNNIRYTLHLFVVIKKNESQIKTTDVARENDVVEHASAVEPSQRQCAMPSGRIYFSSSGLPFPRRVFHFFLSRSPTRKTSVRLQRTVVHIYFHFHRFDDTHWHRVTSWVCPFSISRNCTLPQDGIPCVYNCIRCSRSCTRNRNVAENERDSGVAK